MKRLLLLVSALSAFAVVQAQNPYPIIPIDTVQFVNAQKLSKTPPNDSADYVNPIKVNTTYGDTVRFEGFVLMNPQVYGLSTNRKATFVQRAGGGPWSSVQVMCEPAGTGATLANLITETKFYDNMKVGYKVRVTGVMRQFNGTGFAYGESQVNLIRSLNPNWSNEVELLSLSPVAIPATVLAVDTLQTGNTQAANTVQQKVSGEKYEGVYVELRNVTVYTRTVSGARWTWSVIDDKGNEISIRDLSAYFRNDDNEDTTGKIPNTFTPPIIGARLAYLRGVVVELSGGNPARMMYQLAPLTPGDIGPVTYTPPLVQSVTRSPAIATSSDSVLVAYKTVKGSARITKGHVFYTVGYNNTVFDSVALTMNVVDTTIWFAKIPSRPNGSVVKYFVRISDQNDTLAFFPNRTGLNSAYLVTSGVNSIQTLNFSPYANGNSIWQNDSLLNIDVRGVVTGKNFIAGTTNLITIQAGSSVNSGIFIQRGTPDLASAWNVGDSVQITRATVRESFGLTILNNIVGSVISTGRPLPAFVQYSVDSVLSSKDLMYNDQVEAMLLKFAPAWIANVNPDAPGNFGEFSFKTDSAKTTGLRVDDMSSDLRNLNQKLKVDMKMDYIQGPLYYSFGNYKLIPRTLNDLDLSRIDTLKPVIVLKGAAFDTIKLYQSYVDSGVVAIDDKDGIITSKVVRTGMVDSSTVGSYQLVYKVSDNWGNAADSVVRNVYVKLNTFVNANELNNAYVHVYPSPAGNTLNVAVDGVETLPVTIRMIDIVGRELSSKTIAQRRFVETFDVSALQNGIYFCKVENEKGSKTVKFIVNK